jgi:hypothetical protein
MTRKIHLSLTASLILLSLALAACAGPAPTSPPAASGTFGYEDLVEALEETGAQVQPGITIEQDFFPVGAQVITINGQDVQVFEFDSPASRQAAEATIQGNGFIIGTMSIDWISTPYFFSRDRLIVLYVGTDQSTLETLTGILGPALTGPEAG